jgi:hypothetical protein
MTRTNSRRYRRASIFPRSQHSLLTHFLVKSQLRRTLVIAEARTQQRALIRTVKNNLSVDLISSEWLHIFKDLSLISSQSKHLKTHEPPYVCSICQVTLKRDKDFAKNVARHEQTARHRGKLGGDRRDDQYKCPVTWCGKSWPRKDNFKRHMTSQHPGHDTTLHSTS